jgi:hypothetical protein
VSTDPGVRFGVDVMLSVVDKLVEAGVIKDRRGFMAYINQDDIDALSPEARTAVRKALGVQ